jgi:hypothetical protein
MLISKEDIPKVLRHSIVSNASEQRALNSERYHFMASSSQLNNQKNDGSCLN